MENIIGDIQYSVKQNISRYKGYHGKICIY